MEKLHISVQPDLVQRKIGEPHKESPVVEARKMLSPPKKVGGRERAERVHVLEESELHFAILILPRLISRL